MVKITQDAELMSNFVSANPVPASNRFSVIRDEKGNPAVLSHSEDDKLNLIINVDGRPQLADLGAIWKLPGRVHAFDVTQRADLSVWVAVATAADDGGKSHFSLIQNVQPSALLAFAAEKLTRASKSFSRIHEVYMSNFTRTVAGEPVPLLFLALQPADRITQEDQLGYVDMTVNGSSGALDMALNTSWKLATNPLRILSVAFGTSRVGDGAFVLYTTPSGLKMQFRVFQGHEFSVELNAPAGATSLASYLDPDTKATALLVGGDAVTQYKFGDYTRAGGTGTTVVAGGSSLGVKSMHTAQAEDTITVWYTTRADAAFYYAASTAAVEDGLLVPLLGEGAGARISGMLGSRSSSSGDAGGLLEKTLVAVDGEGQLTVLQQAADTGMWAARRLYVSTARSNVELDTFTIRIQAAATGTGPDEQVAGGALHLAASGHMRVLSNGVAAHVDVAGGWHAADHAGVVTLMVPTEDLACHTLRIDRFRSGNGSEQALDVPVLSPTAKVVARLSGVRTGRDLLDAKTQAGKPLIEPGSVSEEDAGHAAAMMQQLSATHAGKGAVAGDDKPVYLAGKLPDDTALLAEARDASQPVSPWDFFKHIFDGAKEVAAWFLQKIGDAVHFVCEWAGKIYRFVLDTASAIGKAVSWVFAKVKLFIKDVIAFIGYLFDWQYMLRFADSIAAFANAGLEHGMTLLDDVDAKVRRFVDDLEARLKTRKAPPPVAAGPRAADKLATPASDAVQQSPAYGWSSYQLRHGGFARHSSMASSASLEPTAVAADGDDDDPLADVWADFSNEMHAVVGWAEELGHAFKALFGGEGSSDDFFAHVTDATLHLACQTLRNMVDAFLKGLKHVLQQLQRLGHREIDVPVFTPLWRLVSGGRRCTLSNCVALAVAVPASVLYKLANPAAGSQPEPPDLGSWLTADAFRMYVDRDPALAPRRADQMLEAQLAVQAVLAGMAGELSLIAFVSDSTGAGDVSPLVGNVVDCVTFDFLLLELVFSWPARYHHDRMLRWTVWTMEAANGVVLVVSRLWGWKAKIPRYETKRLVGAFEIVTALPIYALQLTIAANEFGAPDDDPDKDDTNDIVTLHVAGDTFQLMSAVGFVVAALADHIDGEITAAGLVVMGLAIGGQVAMKTVEVVKKGL
ncbi:outer membrane protein [Diplodia corticola]|uniref:Outer membrane protein n=1 Tax=Diplodia corticola TaxID=236234 RepID=A0A1J9R0K6_9PEZI|nr:outer membrane protein [Diplodia corticola]OJD34160.1 outer membrane protein [Diplodia corticola]